MSCQGAAQNPVTAPVRPHNLTHDHILPSRGLSFLTCRGRISHWTGGERVHGPLKCLTVRPLMGIGGPVRGVPAQRLHTWGRKELCSFAGSPSAFFLGALGLRGSGPGVEPQLCCSCCVTPGSRLASEPQLCVPRAWLREVPSEWQSSGSHQKGEETRRTGGRSAEAWGGSFECRWDSLGERHGGFHTGAEEIHFSTRTPREAP